MKSKFRVLTLAFALQLMHPAFAASDITSDKTIVFVCLHGSVKSQMAAAHFNRIARERGLPYTAISRGIEVDASIPTRIRDGLRLDGLAPLDDVPQPLMAADAAAAAIASVAVRGCGTSSSGASPSRLKPSLIGVGIDASTSMPREIAVYGSPRSLAILLKCAAAIWPFTEPWRQTNTIVLLLDVVSPAAKAGCIN